MKKVFYERIRGKSKGGVKSQRKKREKMQYVTEKTSKKKKFWRILKLKGTKSFIDLLLQRR